MTIFTKSTISTSGDSVTLTVEGHNAAFVQVTGTWNGSLAFEGTVNGDDWFAVVGTPVPSGSTTSSSLVNGQWTFTVSGLLSLRVRNTVLNSGIVLVAIRAVV